jgi:hypothetical protein
MNIQSEFTKACSEFEEFRKLVARGQQATRDDNLRQQLQTLGKALDQSFAELKEKVPAVADQLGKELKETEQELTRSLADLEARKKALEQAPPPAAAASAAAPVLPAAELGKTLQDELLRLFGEAKKATAVRKVVHDPGSVGGIASSEWKE